MTYKSTYRIQATRFYQCDRKKQYISEWEAKAFADRIFSKFGSRQEPYHCHHCGGWHLRKKRQ